MAYTPEQVQDLALQHFGIRGHARPLPGEIDWNYYLQATDGQAFTLKLANPHTHREILEMQNALMQHLETKELGLDMPKVVPNIQGETITSVTGPDGQLRWMRLLTWIPGRVWAEVNPHSPSLLDTLGAMLGNLSCALADFDHPAAHRFIKWDPAQTGWTKDQMAMFIDPERRELAQYFLDLFERKVQPIAPELRRSVTYNDANDYNILVSHDPANPKVPGVIDFGDVVFSYTVNDLAIAAAYVLMDKPDPLTAASHLVRGYCRHFALTDAELKALFPLIGARLLISVTCSAINLTAEPENEYLQISDRPAWDLLRKLRDIPPALAYYTFRHAAGLEPCPKSEAFQQWAVENYLEAYPIVGHHLQGRDVTWLDLSVGSLDLGNHENVVDAQKLHRQIQHIMADNEASVAIGRYNETRPLYTADSFTVTGNEGPEWRTVHIGLDIFMPAGTPVYAPLDGVVHSIRNNKGERDYGPTIILEHRVSPELTFYTLYGHLTLSSIEHVHPGQFISKGEMLCWMGDMPVNGNWSPHLHFQIILDLLDKEGDFPGVAFPDRREVWTSICPDPWLLLAGKPSVNPTHLGQDTILRYRQEHLSRNLSVSYSKPLYMVRGFGQYLYDATGRRYLDTVNNVAHAGHEHPRVVRAGQRQMAVLNTNTRYLHENIVRFAEAVLATMPEPLSVAMFVNSGSEANELTLRLAKTYTGHKDMVVIEVGYHGNTNACVEVSSYKFDGPGGKGAPAHVHVVPMPDTYRGLYRRSNHAADHGRLYAQHVQDAIEQVQAKGRNIAGFLCESVISCGGQIPLPEGYLAAAYRHVREAGGVCIADEVQTGCGRAGRYFWAFEEQGVVPDIVTIGKPIGNGHPLGVVVTTPAIAQAFNNGMEYFNTFGGNPVSCAIGLEVLKVIHEEGLQQNALETGAYLREGLEALQSRHAIIGDVRGPGLFLGFELVKDLQTLEPAPDQTAYLANRMRELGILMSTDGPFHNVLKIKPPLVFNRQDADFLIGTLDRVFLEDFMRDMG